MSKVNRFKQNRLGLTIALVVIALFAGIGVYKYVTTDAAPKNRQQSSVGLYANPSSGRIKTGDTVSMQVWVDTLTQPTTAVQANITYPTQFFEFVAIDTSTSEFGIDVQASGGDGVIKIARGNFAKLTGKHLVATIQLRALTKASSANLNFTAESEIINADTFQNILATSSGAKFSIQ